MNNLISMGDVLDDSGATWQDNSRYKQLLVFAEFASLLITVVTELSKQGTHTKCEVAMSHSNFIHFPFFFFLHFSFH